MGEVIFGPTIIFCLDHSQNLLQILDQIGGVGRFGLVNPGHHSKVFGDIHNYLISSAKKDLPPFFVGNVTRGGLM